MIGSTKSGAPAATARRGLTPTLTLTLYLKKDSSVSLARSATFSTDSKTCRKLRYKIPFESLDNGSRSSRLALLRALKYRLRDSVSELRRYVAAPDAVLESQECARCRACDARQALWPTTAVPCSHCWRTGQETELGRVARSGSRILVREISATAGWCGRASCSCWHCRTQAANNRVSNEDGSRVGRWLIQK